MASIPLLISLFLKRVTRLSLMTHAAASSMSLYLRRQKQQWATSSEARESVVWIQSEFVYTDGTNTFTVSACGSGFAIGKPGDLVSNIVTNAHVVVDDYGNKANMVFGALKQLR